MHKAEYWLLDAVATFRFPLALLVAPHLTSILNRPSHGVDVAALTSTLDRLFQAGYLNAAQERYNNHLHVFVPTRMEVANALFADTHTHYGLTEVGGNCWERLAQADWTRYIEASHLYSGGEIICSDRQWAEQHLRMQTYLGQHVLIETVQWDVITPWQATYWKVLPQGYRARYQYTSKAWDAEERRKGMQWLKHVNQWYTPPNSEP